VTASRDLTFAHIAEECVRRKGVELVGVVDCASPAVQGDIEQLLACGEMVELAAGGLRYRGEVTVVLGAELETVEAGGGASHQVSYFGHLEQVRAYSRRLRRHVTNLELSSQCCRLPAAALLEMTLECGGLFVPAHCFTPHRSVYGHCVRRLHQMFTAEQAAQIPAVELGLSADSSLADRIEELRGKTFLSNSDAHSLPRIAREHNLLRVTEPSFEELRRALLRQQGRRVVANFGLDPRLGKYHRTRCDVCSWITTAAPPVRHCEHCGELKVTMGVLDRITEIADWPEPRPPRHRPPYQHQVPLQFVPKVGAVTLNRLINRFGSEMAVLHQASPEDLALTIGGKVADLIIRAREGRLVLEPGGGGRYGRALADVASTQMSLPGLAHE